MKRAFGLMLIVILVAGCAASRTQVLQPKKAEFHNYPVLEITDLKTNVGAQVPSELLQTLPETIADKVRSLNLFQAVNRVPVEAEAVPATKTLVLQGTVIEYEPGSRALRYFIGFGAGKAFVTVQLTAIDKVTREEIFKGNIGGEQSMGIFGGSINEVIQKIADESVECIKMNYAAEERVPSLPKEVKSPTISKEQQVASLPKNVERPIVRELKLRDTPKEIGQNDLNRMIEEYNFYEKNLNGSGDFPNDFVDNGDGTITDRATGLMWEKGGSSSVLLFSKAKKYVSRLNKDTFAGYNDWRIPTLEELCSLLEQKVNERGQHISSLFKDKQSKCLSEDFVESRYTKYCGIYSIVNFTKGKIDETATEHIDISYCHSVFFYIRAVRTIK